MNSRLKNAVLAAALACSAGGAMAQDMSIPHDLSPGPYYPFVEKDAGAFVDTFTFTLGSLPATASFTIDELSLGSFTNIDWDDTAAATLSGGGLAAPMVLGEAGIDTPSFRSAMSRSPPVPLC